MPCGALRIVLILSHATHSGYGTSLRIAPHRFALRSVLAVPSLNIGDVRVACMRVLFVQECQDELRKFRAIAVSYRNSPLKTAHLQAICDELGIEARRLALDNVTRWNSVFAMLKSLHQMRVPIEHIIAMSQEQYLERKWQDASEPIAAVNFSVAAREWLFVDYIREVRIHRAASGCADVTHSVHLYRVLRSRWSYSRS
jgi:hypothetical protein